MSWFGSASRWVGTSNRFLQVGAAALAVSAPALAADWSLHFGASQSLTADDNLDLDETNRDAGLTSSTSFDLDLLAKAKTYKIDLAPRITVEKTFFQREPDDWSYFPSGTLSLGTWTKRTTYDLVASMARSEASANDLVEDVITTNQGDELTYAVTGTMSHKVNSRNTLTWVNSANLVDFSLPSDDLVPALTLRTSGTWSREMSELTTGHLTASAEYYDPDSPTVGQRLLYRATAGLNTKLSKRLSVAGAVGAVVLDPEEGGVTANMIFNVSADYKLKTTSYSLSASRDLTPDDDGSLNDRYSTRLGVSHQVNDLTTIGLVATYAFQTDAAGEKSNAFTVSPTISYQLSQDWSSSLSYRFVEEDDATSKAHSNAVTLTLSYGTFLLP
jgi:hypothetical protein